jgi:vancomycin permeability regulator SanA
VTATDDDPRRRIRQLLLSGDNLCKTRNDPVAAGRARERFAHAQVLAPVHGFDDLAGIIELRLADLDTVRPSDA